MILNYGQYHTAYHLSYLSIDIMSVNLIQNLYYKWRRFHAKVKQQQLYKNCRWGRNSTAQHKQTLSTKERKQNWGHARLRSNFIFIGKISHCVIAAFSTTDTIIMRIYIASNWSWRAISMDNKIGKIDEQRQQQQQILIQFHQNIRKNVHHFFNVFEHRFN